MAASHARAPEWARRHKRTQSLPPTLKVVSSTRAPVQAPPPEMDEHKDMPIAPLDGWYSSVPLASNKPTHARRASAPPTTGIPASPLAAPTGSDFSMIGKDDSNAVDLSSSAAANNIHNTGAASGGSIFGKFKEMLKKTDSKKTDVGTKKSGKSSTPVPTMPFLDECFSEGSFKKEVAHATAEDPQPLF